LAVREHPRFEVSDVELGRAGPSYTVDTLGQLADRGELFLVVGSETFLDLLSWREPERVVRLARLVGVPRGGTGFHPDSPATQKVLSGLGLAGCARSAAAGDGAGTGSEAPPAPLLVETPSLPISASDLRRRAREGRSLAYRTPAPVVAYIRDHGLYRADR